MKRRIVVRLAKLRKYSKNNMARVVVVAYNDSPTNAGHIEKIGTYSKFSNVSNEIQIVATVNLKRLVYWIKKGAYVKDKPSWLIGMLGHGEIKG